MGKSYINKKFRVFMIVSIIGLLATVFCSIFFGKYSINSQEILKIIGDKNIPEELIVKKHILFDIRIPRIILSGFVGAALALSGTVLQGVLMNPLASPDVLGTSSAAGFGASLGILLFPENLYLIAGLSFTLGIISVVLIYYMCKTKKDYTILSIVLSGIIISSIFMSLTALVKFMADTENTLPAITFWLMGSFVGATSFQIKLIITPFLVGGFIIYILRWKINLLSLGDEEARLLGVNPTFLRGILIIISTILIAGSTTVAGIIGWVGLVIPHIVRKIIGENHGYVIPLVIVIGSVFMIIADNLARNIAFSEVPIGILTSLIGAPLFALLFFFKREDNE